MEHNRAGALSGVKNSRGCGSKVITAELKCKDFAVSTSFSSNA
jgi:hypothetical protein